MVKIIPAILTNEMDTFEEMVGKCVGKVESVQIDFIDGEYADNKTLEPSKLKLSGFEDLKFDAHLMVAPANLESWIAEAINAGCTRIFFHIENIKNIEDFVGQVKQSGCEVGLAVDLDTKISEVEPYLKNVDAILVMSVPAGFGGQKFSLAALEKIAWLRGKKTEEGLDFAIQDDGGVTVENIDDSHFVGADEVVIGRKLFSGDLAENLEKFQKAAHTLKMPKT